MWRVAAALCLLLAALGLCGGAASDAGSPFDRVRNAAVLSGAPDNFCRTAGVTFNTSVGSPAYLLSRIPAGLVPLLVGNASLLRRAFSVNSRAGGQDWDYAVYHADFGCVDLGNSTGLPIVMSNASMPGLSTPLQFSSTIHPSKIDPQHRNDYEQDNLAQCLTFRWDIGQPPKVAAHPTQNLDGYVSYSDIPGTPALSQTWLGQLFQSFASGGDAAAFSRDLLPTVVGPLFTHGVLRYGSIPTPSSYTYQVPTSLTCALANADAQAEAAFRSGVSSVNNSWYKVVTAVWPNVLTMAVAAWLLIDSFKAALSERAGRWERWDRKSRLNRTVNLLGNLRRLFLQLTVVVCLGLTVLIVQCTSERSGLLANWGAAYGLTVTYDTSNGSRWGPLRQDSNNAFAGAAYIVSPWVVIYELQAPCGTLGLAVVYGAVAFTGCLWAGAILYLNWRQQSDLYRSMSGKCRAPTTRTSSPVLWLLRYRQRRWAMQQPRCEMTAERFGRALFAEFMALDIAPVIDKDLRMKLMRANDGVFNRFKTRAELDYADAALRKLMSDVLSGKKNPTDDILLRVLCNTSAITRNGYSWNDKSRHMLLPGESTSQLD
jgi:hypothetical protein